MATLEAVWGAVMAGRNLRPTSAALREDVENSAGDSWAVAFTDVSGQLTATVTTSVRGEGGELHELPMCPHCAGSGSVAETVLAPGDDDAPSKSGKASKQDGG